MTENETPDQLTPDQMRAAPGTGRDNLEPTEMDTWDGSGNPVRHVFTDDGSGHLSEGTGRSTEDASKNAQDPDDMLSEDTSPGGMPPGSG